MEQEKFEYYIYKITNLINGKLYVGQHKVRPNETPRSYMGKGVALQEAFKKYGRENFDKEIIETIWDDERHEYVSERERYWIAKLNTMAPNGYNLSPGGEGGCTKEAAAKGVATKKANGYHHSKETKKKMSEAAKGRVFTEEHKQHLSENHHLKTEHIILFKDGHIEKTTDSFKTIAERFETNQNTLIRYSVKKQFINGIYLLDEGLEKRACNKTYKNTKKYYDPIKNDICSYQALYKRKKTYPEKYKDIIVTEQEVKE